MSIEIEAAAAVLAEAQVTATSAVAALTAAQASRKEVTDRIAAIEADRAGILAARRCGEDKPDHGARLALIDADRQTLLEIDTERAAAVALAQGAATSARQAVSRAEQHLAMAQDVVLEERLTIHADKLGGLLSQTISELRAVWTRRGARPTWFPNTGLAEEVYRLHLMANQVRR